MKITLDRCLVCVVFVVLVISPHVAMAQDSAIQSVAVPVEFLTNSRSNSTFYSYVIGRSPDNANIFQYLTKPLTQNTGLYACPGLIWDGRAGQFCSTGGNWRSANDPVDHRMVRFGGGTVLNPDYDAPLYPGALVGQIGHSVIVNRKIKAYETVFQFHTNNNRTGYVCLSMSQGQNSVTRDGQLMDMDESPCMFMWTAAGQLIIGAQAVTRITSVVIHGDLVVDGCIIVGGKLIAGVCKGDVQKAAEYEKQILSMRERKKDNPDPVLEEQP